jgi:hypothetical protein
MKKVILLLALGFFTFSATSLMAQTPKLTSVEKGAVATTKTNTATVNSETPPSEATCKSVRTTVNAGAPKEAINNANVVKVEKANKQCGRGKNKTGKDLPKLKPTNGRVEKHIPQS